MGLRRPNAMPNSKNDREPKLTMAQAIRAFLRECRAEDIDALTVDMSAEEASAAAEAVGVSRSEQEAFFEELRKKFRDTIERDPR
jgi:hypothetical protein